MSICLVRLAYLIDGGIKKANIIIYFFYYIPSLINFEHYPQILHALYCTGKTLGFSMN